MNKLSSKYIFNNSLRRQNNLYNSRNYTHTENEEQSFKGEKIHNFIHLLNTYNILNVTLFPCSEGQIYDNKSNNCINKIIK